MPAKRPASTPRWRTTSRSSNWEKFVFLVAVERHHRASRVRRSAWCAPTLTCAGCSSRRCARPGRRAGARRQAAGRFRREAAGVRRHPARRDARLDAARPGGRQPPRSAVAVRRAWRAWRARPGYDAPVNRAVYAALKPYVNGSAEQSFLTRRRGPALRHDAAARRHAARADRQRRGQARRAPRRPAARRRGGVRHPGRDRPHQPAAAVPVHRHGRSARIRRRFYSAWAADRLQGARHDGRGALARLADGIGARASQCASLDRRSAGRRACATRCRCRARSASLRTMRRASPSAAW